jgi:hypothetical protein
MMPRGDSTGSVDHSADSEAGLLIDFDSLAKEDREAFLAHLETAKDLFRQNRNFEGLFSEAIEKDVGWSILPLTRFKVLLCRLKIKNAAAAAETITGSDLLDDAPRYCHGQATLAFHDENHQEAEEWISRASRIFRDPAFLEPWNDTFREYGYFTTLKGALRNNIMTTPGN